MLPLRGFFCPRLQSFSKLQRECLMNSTEMIETLRDGGYMTGAEMVDGVERVQIICSTHEYLITDFAAGTRRYMRDPTVSVAVLEFTVADASPLATKFIAELVKLVAPADRLLKKRMRPLVRTTATTLHAVYQSKTQHVELRDDTHPARPVMFRCGLAFRDRPNPFSQGHLRAHCVSVLADGTWLAERTPLNTPHASLPTWSAEEMAPKLRAFVDKAITAGELRESGPYVPPPRPIDPTDTDGHADLYERAGIRVVYTDDDVPPPMEYNDERLRKAFGVPLGTEPTGNGFATRRRG
jgi:hypothetical protein